MSIAANDPGLYLVLPYLKYVGDLTFHNITGVYMGALAFARSIEISSGQIANFVAPGLESTGKSLVIQDCPSLTNVSLESLKQIGGNLVLANNTNLTAISGFSCLNAITGAMNLTGVFERQVHRRKMTVPSPEVYSDTK